MIGLSLTDLFYHISGIKPKLSDLIVGPEPDRPIFRPERFTAITNSDLAEYRARQFIHKEELTRQAMKFDKWIPTFSRYRNQPTARDEYQERIWHDLLACRNAEGWGNRSAKLIARSIQKDIACDSTLFGIRARLFCDLVVLSAGQDVTAVNPNHVRMQARSLTRAFFAQKDYLSAAICLLLEALITSTQAMTDRDPSLLKYAITAIKAAEDLLIGRPREYERRLVTLVLFQAAAYGIDIAVTARDEQFALLQMNLLEDTWQYLAGDAHLKDWLLFMLLRSQSNYYLFARENDRCAECLIRACALYDRLGQNLPFLTLLLRICCWSKRVRPNVPLYEALQIYTERWKQNPRLSHLVQFEHLLGPSAQKLGLTTHSAMHSEFGARVAILSKEDGLLRL
jgi:hypothetical protein